MLFSKRKLRIALLVVGLAVLPGINASAHFGHDDTIPLPAWKFQDGRELSAYVLKSSDGKVWLVDALDQTQVVDLSTLDVAGQQLIKHTRSRLRLINSAPIAQVPLKENVFAFPLTGLMETTSIKKPEPEAAKIFAKFEGLKTHFDDNYIYIESNGLPEHPMMKGITAWQQQVPLPQAYVGDNAWRLPLKPVPAKTPASIKNHFLRGAIAIGANSIPIFNPQNNRGELSQEIGELDEWGGHCGRADDYHYHITPMHLQEKVGKGNPVAYALDGYPIYGLTEPDGSPIGKLDECMGHTTKIGYHYHGSNKYPYVMAAFHGEVVEAGGQVDPQPRANPVRPAMQPLRGAKITELKTLSKESHELLYEINGKSGSVRYTLNIDGGYGFVYTDTNGNKTEQAYQKSNLRPGDGKGGGGQGGNGSGGRPNRPQGNAAPEGVRPQVNPANPAANPANNVAVSDPMKDANTFALTSPEVKELGALPVEFTGDGASATLPLNWKNPPAGTKNFAVIMDHFPGPGDVKWYWILYNIPADVRSLDKNTKDVGTLGNNSVNRRQGYAPPHSKGPGAKKYILTVYALSSPVKIDVSPSQVNREILLAAMKDKILGKAELNVIYDRTNVINGGGDGNARGNGGAPENGPPAVGAAPGGFRIMPRNIEEQLKITDDQHAKIQALEKETQDKLEKILTPEQIRIIQESRPRRPAGPNDGPTPN